MVESATIDANGVIFASGKSSEGIAYMALNLNTGAILWKYPFLLGHLITIL